MPIQQVYWDANVFHALFSKEKGRVEACERLHDAARGGKLLIYTSAITFAECVWLKGLPRLSKEHEAVIQKFFMHKYIEIINCDRMAGTTLGDCSGIFRICNPKTPSMSQAPCRSRWMFFTPMTATY